MQRRDFLNSGVALAVAAEVEMGKAHAFVLAHNCTNTTLGLVRPSPIALIKDPSAIPAWLKLGNGRITNETRCSLFDSNIAGCAYALLSEGCG